MAPAPTQPEGTPTHPPRHPPKRRSWLRRSLLIIAFLFLGSITNWAVTVAGSMKDIAPHYDDVFWRSPWGDPKFPPTWWPEQKTWLTETELDAPQWKSLLDWADPRRFKHEFKVEHRNLQCLTGRVWSKWDVTFSARISRNTAIRESPRTQTFWRCIGGWPFTSWSCDGTPWPRRYSPPIDLVNGAIIVGFESSLIPDSSLLRSIFPVGTILPFRPEWPGLIANTCFYAGALWLGVFALAKLVGGARRYRRRRTNRCPNCNYPRTGLAPQSPCPECGTAPT